MAAERERGRSGEREKGRRVDATHTPEMLSWLREDEMSVQGLLQRVQCVITHVGKSLHFTLFFPHLPLHMIKKSFCFQERGKTFATRRAVFSWSILPLLLVEVCGGRCVLSFWKSSNRL